jgi:hypothetical protein
MTEHAAWYRGVRRNLEDAMFRKAVEEAVDSTDFLALKSVSELNELEEEGGELVGEGFACACGEEGEGGEEEGEEEHEAEKTMQHSTSDLSVSAEAPAALSDAEVAHKLALLRAEESWLESSLRARIRYLSGQE